MDDRARVVATGAERPPPGAPPPARAGPARRPAFAHAVRVGRRDDPAEAAAERVAAAAARSDDRVVAPARSGSLDPAVRGLFQSRLGADLGAVRVHTGPAAAAAAEALGAAAFAVGDDIAFAPGHYDPAGARGRRLLAHELAHVVAERRHAGPPVLRRQTSEAVQEREARFPPEIVEPVVDDADWLPAPDTLVSFVSDDNRLFLLSGGPLVLQVPPQTLSRIRPLLGLPGVGHGQSIVVSTGRGEAVIFDAGGSIGLAAYRTQLTAVAGQMSVVDMLRLYISHGHTDHYNLVFAAVEQYGIAAENVVIPDYQAPWAKAFLRAWQAFAATPRGRALGYDRVTPGTELIERDPGAQVYKIEFEHGDIRFVYHVEADVVRRLDAKPKRAGGLADAAAGLVFLTQRGTLITEAIVSDMRGRDIEDLRVAMEAQEPGSFAKAFRRVRGISGFQHHLGAVNDAKDVEGIRSVLLVTATTERLEVRVQTDNDVLRPALVEALNALGVDVVVVGRPAEGEKSSAIATGAGEATLRGSAARRFAAPEAGFAARSRLGMLRAFEQALERFGPGLEKSTELGDPVKLLEEVRKARAEVEQLYGGLTRDIVGSLTPAQRRAGAAPTPQAIAARQAQIMDPARLPASLAKEAEGMTVSERLDLLARLMGNEEVLKAEVDETLRTGEVRPRLRALMEVVSPAYARQVLEAAPGTAAGRRAALRQLNRQAQLAGAGWGGTFSTSQKIGRGALALFEIARIGLELHQSRVQLDRALSIEALNDFYWWSEKGALPPFAGVIWHPHKTNEFIVVVDDRGRYDDAQAKQLAKRINDLDAITLGAPVDEGSWLRFALWVDAQIRSIDDFDAHFVRGNPPVHWVGDLTDAKWTLRVTDWGPWLDVTTSLEENEKLTLVMTRAAKRVIAGTEAAIERTWERRDRPAGPRPAAGEPEPARLPGESPLERLRPTRRARFKAGSDRELFSSPPERELVRELDWLTKEPSMLVFETAPAPPGFVVVGGADYNTYATIRTASLVRYREGSILISEDRSKRSEGEKQALMAVVAHTAERLPLDRPMAGYNAQVRYLETVPNEAATGLAKRTDLDFSEPRR